MRRLLVALVVFLLRQLGRLLLLAGVALVAAVAWLSPRAWRLLVRAVRALWRRWQEHRHPLAEEVPGPPALTRLPHGHVLWSEVSKESRR
ncbi:hypothetical protein ABGB07_39875 [Micromonosporaceae bacterium B7E4]